MRISYHWAMKMGKLEPVVLSRVMKTDNAPVPLRYMW